MTKFGYIDKCSLAQAVAEGRTLTEVDHLGKCNHAACPECGKGMARRFALLHENAAEAVVGCTAEFLFTWPNLPNHSASAAEVIRFLDAVRGIVAWIERRCRWASLVQGSQGVTHYNFLPGSNGDTFQPHLHAGALLRFNDAETVQIILELRWRKLGGARVILSKNGHRGNLGGLLRYLRKHPVGASDADHPDEATLNQWRGKLHDRVLNRVEQELRRPAFLTFATGVYAGKDFAKLQAHARYERLVAPEERLDSPDRKAPPPPKGVHRVLVKRSCPKCYAPQRLTIRYGHTKSGRARFRCKKCGATFTKAHRSPYARKHVPHSRILVSDARRMYRRFRAGEGIAAIARDEGRHRATVTKAIAYAERTTPVRTAHTLPPPVSVK